MTDRSLSVLLTSLPGLFPEVVAKAAGLGFGLVDVVAVVERPLVDREAIAAAGVGVACAALGRDLSAGLSLDALSMTTRRAAVEEVKRQLNDAAALGATCAYLVPPLDDRGACLPAFAEVCGLLAEHAAARMIQLCLEPIPGRLVPDARAMLAFLDEAAHPNLGLLLDVGHCLISGEDPAEMVRRAGPRLAYVHLDDNDGVGDLHWPLLTGRLTEDHLRQLGQALRDVGHRGGIALELNPKNPDPEEALRRSKTLAERWL
jgi:sugar phosphate isomerase/epimerase